LFFPQPPDLSSVPDGFKYPEQCCEVPQIWCSQIMYAIGKLKPHKMPYPGDIPNVVLKRCTDILVDPLRRISQACIDLSIQPSTWHKTAMLATQKPGKDGYSIPKSY
jgi:hypothetical protein